MKILLHVILFFILIFTTHSSFAACGANTRTWEADAGTTAWNTNNNWNPANRPNTTGENAVIISDWRVPLYPGNNFSLGCMEVQSGTLTISAGGRLTIVGDYFRNLNLGSLDVPGGSTWEVRMQASAEQTFENVDSIPRLRINNSDKVILTEAFTISNRFLIDSGTGEVVIEGDLTMQQTGAFTIPASTTVTLSSGVTWNLAGNLVIDGTLQMESGSKIKLANGRSLTIGVTGTLDVNGTSGNAATIDAENASSSFTFTSNGTVDFQYLVLDHMTATGANLNATVSRFDNVNINSIPSGGTGITLGAAATIPSEMDSVGFFDDGTAGPFNNIDALNYVNAATNLTNWSGIGDTANEIDPLNRINWGTEATPVLQIQNISPSGVPPTTIAKGSAYTHFSTFAFSMSGTAVSATDVTEVIFTIDGTNFNSDIAGVRVFNDTNNNCSYDAGTDVQIGGTLSPTGTPGKVTLSMSSSEINVIDTTQDCLHVLMATNGAATTDNSIGIKINATDDVTNSQSYALSDTSGPPVSTGTAIITGTSVARWNGGYSTNMFTANNWTPSGVPGTATDCEIGNGYSVPRMSGTFNCQNTKFQSSGSINWNNSTNNYRIYGAWTVESGFTYTNSNNAIVDLRGAGDQAVTLNSTTFPNDLRVNNTGGTVTFEDTGTIAGDLTLSNGDIRIANGASLTVQGDITVASGSTFDIDPGGTLILGNGSTLTVSSGGTLELVGNFANSSTIQAVNNASSYTVTINNGATISAQYYTLKNLGATGLTINATSNIDATNFLQNGTFTYPGVNSANLLRLFQEIPGDTLDGMSFDSDGSTATSVISVFTSTGATADTLDMTNYSGDMTGATFTNDTNYLVNWSSETNELKLTQESTAPASSNQGDIVDMGTFGFQQLNAGSFNDTDITYIRVTLTGTGSSSDVDSVSLYYDAACSGSGGTLIGSKSFTGNPPRAEFTSISGATVESDLVTPPLRCINVEYNINALATDGKTVGVEINSSTHVTNSENFEFNAAFSPSVALGTTSIVGNTTQWTGATNTDWFTASNWSSGLPSSTLNCIINDQANDPVIGAGTATCKSVDIGNGSLTVSGGSLEVYGSLESTGTLTTSVPIVMRDDGATPTSQNIDISSSINELQFNKTAGGSININSNVSVTTAMNINGAQDFTMNITNNNSLILSGGLTLSGAVIDMDGGSELQIASGQTLLVNGGTFRTSGTNDAYPQTLSTKAYITNTGGTGTWTFSATSGTVDLTGFYIDWLDTSGLNFSGTSNLSNLNGGQLRNLPSSAGMRALQFNTSGSLPTTASNFGWNWGPTNTPPSEATSYFLGFSSGCGSQVIDFDQWFGDFWPYTTASTSDKISATTCTILIDRAKSPVSLTEFKATPYDNKVVVEWTTGNEWDHKGFNVYRSLSPDDGFVQINTSLIKNDLFSTSIHGTYAFIDDGAQNGKTYYYMLEDHSLLGESTLHGPLSATPDAALGAAPSIDAGTIASTNDDNGDGDGNGSNGSVSEIARNVWVLSQTQNFLRLKVVVPALSTSVDPDDGAYTKLAIQDYSPSTTEGAPELPTRTILVKVDNDAASATYSTVNHQQSLTSSIQVSPAPKYVVSGNQYITQWYKDNSAYATDAFAPSPTIALQSVTEINGQKYLPVQVHPVAFNPVQQKIDTTSEITIDIYLEGTAPWSQPNLSSNAWANEGGLKIGIHKDGMYKVTYDELETAGVIAPFDGANINDLHLKVVDVELSMDIDSGSGFFSSGDSITFFAPHLTTDEDLLSYVLLYVDDQSSGLQMSSVDADPSALDASTNSGFWTKKHFEENNIAIFNEPYTENTDHFVWSLIYGISGGASSPLVTDVELPNLNPQQEVVIQVLVKSRTANAVNTNHHLQLLVNENTTPVAETSFTSTEPHIVQFRVNGSHFVSGKNKFTLEATGQNIVAGEYDMIYIDTIDVYYSQSWLADSDQALVLDQQPGSAYLLDGFSSSQVLAYDISNPSDIQKLTNVDIQASGLGFSAEFGLDGSSQGKKVLLTTESTLLESQSLNLIYGSDLSNTNNKADVLYIGHRDMLGAINELAHYRAEQGHLIYKASLEDIYNEFGKGLANVDSIKEFISYTRTNWSKKPSYIILLGDGTYDPKAYQNSSMPYRFPIKFMMGSSLDYGSDNWFVSDETNNLPQEVIARIPAQTPSELLAYAEKVLSYENGDSKPNSNSKMTFFSDTPQYDGEDFEKPVTDLQSFKNSGSVSNDLDHIKRSTKTDGEMKTSILQSFDNSSLIHYMGHGAENMWADYGVFENTDINGLTNSKLPVVVAMNCLNGHFYDPSLESLGETMVLKKTGGAIAFWGSTSMTPPTLQGVYQNSFYENLMDGQIQTLGDLVKMSKTQAGLSSPFSEILNSWVILGDPLVNISLKTVTSTNTETPQTPAPEVSSDGGGSSGCSAFANNQAFKTKTPWDLFFAFLLEVLFMLVAIRLIARASQRLNSTE